MSEDRRIRDTDTVDDVLRRFPETADVFFANRMACVGCALARFQTLRDAAAAYDLSLPRLVTELLAARSGPEAQEHAPEHNDAARLRAPDLSEEGREG